MGSEAKWTPGPLEAQPGDGDEWVVADEDGVIVARITADIEHEGRTEADARLIAAAPALADVLRGYEAWEAKLILCQEAWRGGLADFPTLTEELWDGLVEMQAKRNAALSLAKKGGK